MLHCGMSDYDNKLGHQASQAHDLMVTYEALHQLKSPKDRINLIRKGVPYIVIEQVGHQGGLSVRSMLGYLGLAQTTYNKRKRENAILSGRDSEIIIILSELFDYGLSVFNQERQKFHRWLQKNNRSLGGVAPSSLFDTITGISEVRYALDRMEHGNMA